MREREIKRKRGENESEKQRETKGANDYVIGVGKRARKWLRPWSMIS